MDSNLKCVFCGTNVNKKDKFCTKCGKAISASKINKKTLTCSCGAKINANDKFCTKCGRALTVTESHEKTLTCSRGAKLNEKDKFCTKCGKGNTKESSVSKSEPLSPSASGITKPDIKIKENDFIFFRYQKLIYILTFISFAVSVYSFFHTSYKYLIENEYTFSTFMRDIFNVLTFRQRMYSSPVGLALFSVLNPLTSVVFFIYLHFCHKKNKMPGILLVCELLMLSNFLLFDSYGIYDIGILLIIGVATIVIWLWEYLLGKSARFILYCGIIFYVILIVDFEFIIILKYMLWIVPFEIFYKTNTIKSLFKYSKRRIRNNIKNMNNEKKLIYIRDNHMMDNISDELYMEIRKEIISAL